MMGDSLPPGYGGCAGGQRSMVLAATENRMGGLCAGTNKTGHRERRGYYLRQESSVSAAIRVRPRQRRQVGRQDGQ
jgi:hypothetical protein